MRARHIRSALLVIFVLLLATGCSMPAALSGSRSQADIQREWEGKGFGFVWDEPIPDTAVSGSPLRFSGVAYGCTINDFYVNLEVSGPVGEGANLTLMGSATISDAPVVEPPPSTSTIYLLEVPLTGLLSDANDACDAQYTTWLSVRVDLAARTATIQEATATGGGLTCTRGGVTVSIELPVPSQLPRPAGIPINVLETEACRQDLQSLP